MPKKKPISDIGQTRHSKPKKTTLKNLPKFMKSIASDHLLLEIFTRLRNSRTIFNCASVCKRWNSIITHPNFTTISKRRRSNNNKSHLPWTMIFKDQEYFKTNKAYLFSDESTTLHSLNPSNLRSKRSKYLSFLPFKPLVMASFNDLVLVRIAHQNFCICNPLTKQWISLPSQRGITYPDSDFEFNHKRSNASFVCEIDQSSTLVNYTVLLHNSYMSAFDVAVFRSRTGRWEKNFHRFVLPQNTFIDTHIIGTSDGTFYSFVNLATNSEKYHAIKIAAFDESDPMESFSEISLPLGFRSEHSQMGLVKGKLRIWDSYLDESAKFVAKIWEIDGKCDNNNWKPLTSLSINLGVPKIYSRDGNLQLKLLQTLQDSYLKSGVSIFDRNSFVKMFHPENDKLFYFMNETQDFIYQYNFETGVVVKVVNIGKVWPFDKVYFLEHRLWPTSITPLIKNL